MNDKYFLDTNIIVYSFDNTSPAKRDTARKLISQALSSDNGCISFQVIQEFLNVATRKFVVPLPIAHARQYLEEVLQPLCEAFPGNDFYLRSLVIKERTGFSFYDSMIVEAALENDCRTLYTEDMQDGFKLFDLTIRNPFDTGTDLNQAG
jgi:predicted nucleic acid-binding protein